MEVDFDWLTQVVAGLKALIRNPKISVTQLMRHIPAPDFPTGRCFGGELPPPIRQGAVRCREVALA